jgi:hypothetical protein
MKFEQILKSKYNIEPSKYMEMARERADKLGYDLDKLKFADDDTHKLEYDGVKFGNVCCKDFIIYYLKDGKEKAEEKRKLYHKRMFATSEGRTITKKMKLTKIQW